MQRKAIALVACLAIGVSGWAIWGWFRHSPSGNYQPILSSLGNGIAEQVVQAIHDKGTVVLVDLPEGDEPDLRREAFLKKLRQHPGVQLVATEIVPQLQMEDRMTPSCPVTVFQEILQRRSGVSVIVFLVPVPEWSRAEKSLPTAGTPKLIVMDPTTVQIKDRYGGYFDRGILSALIILRRDSTTVSAGAPKTEREYFDRDYQILTTENYGTVLEP